ncbi:MAG: histidinol-phosphate transaminase [Ignavibacteriaceae bacterium]|nr:histidinol-phosphate transaminase [Ignavibacteriaceae bacterium]
MMDLKKLVRKNILELKPYTSARDQYQDGILLDANENSFGSAADFMLENLNRYPDPQQKVLRKALSEYLKIEISKLMFGVGSDQIIDLVIRVFCEPGKSNVIIPSPTYGVFKVACNINDIEIQECELDSEFDIDVESIIQKINKRTKIIFLCSPNNPTGNSLNPKKILKLAEAFEGIIFIDEAYIEFSSEKSFLNYLKHYNNIIISRTFSKAWGMAAVRCGYCIADDFIIGLLFKVKDPYSINKLTEKTIIEALQKPWKKDELVSNILREKDRLILELRTVGCVDYIYPTDANFILAKIKNADAVFNYLNQKKIRVRIRKDNERIASCLRITVGNKFENDFLIKTLKELN